MIQKFIDPRKFDFVVGKAREYFRGLGFVEVHADSYLSILAACEDPRTIVPFEFEGTSWPAAQTAQMWLEQWLLADPSLPGLVTISTSNRNEPNPIPGRHDKRFPMIEFETHGGMEKLAKIDFGLLRALGFPPESFGEGEYVRTGCFWNDDNSLKHWDACTPDET